MIENIRVSFYNQVYREITAMDGVLTTIFSGDNIRTRVCFEIREGQGCSLTVIIWYNCKLKVVRLLNSQFFLYLRSGTRIFHLLQMKYCAAKNILQTGLFCSTQRLPTLQRASLNGLGTYLGTYLGTLYILFVSGGLQLFAPIKLSNVDIAHWMDVALTFRHLDLAFDTLLS